jgi:hypothetical protein
MRVIGDLMVNVALPAILLFGGSIFVASSDGVIAAITLLTTGVLLAALGATLSTKLRGPTQLRVLALLGCGLGGFATLGTESPSIDGMQTMPYIVPHVVFVASALWLIPLLLWSASRLKAL